LLESCVKERCCWFPRWNLNRRATSDRQHRRLGCCPAATTASTHQATV
jgi:hypothetical protein